MNVAAAAGMQDQPQTPDRGPAPAGVACLRVAGPLTAVTAPGFRARVRQAVDDYGQARLLIDLNGVTAVDAAGIAALLDARRVLEAQTGGTLVLRANAVVCRALRDTGTYAAFALWNGPGM
jgi:anti-anti-sigma factor